MLVITYESIKDITLYIMDKDRYNERKEKEMQKALDTLIFGRFII